MSPTQVHYCPENPGTLHDCKISTCPCCDGLGVAARCPNCEGAGAFVSRTLREAQLAHVNQLETCAVCKGRGWFPITQELYERLGFITQQEIEDLNLRKRPHRALMYGGFTNG